MVGKFICKKLPDWNILKFGMDFKTVNKWEPRMWSEANMEVPTEADSKKSSHEKA